MPSSLADRNLLYGMLALQLDFINREQLIDAMHSWVLNKQESLAEILQQQKYLSPEKCRMLGTLVEEQIQHHGNDLDQGYCAC